MQNKEENATHKQIRDRSENITGVGGGGWGGLVGGGERGGVALGGYRLVGPAMRGGF